MKGIVLSGGSGTRLYPLTISVSKQLLPVYNKPLIYYPISVLMLAGIRDILIVTTPHDEAIFRKLFGTGKQFGISVSYAVQPKPEGIAQSFLIAEEFIGDDNISLILGDNIFYGHGFSCLLNNATARKEGATIFGYRVKDPNRFGVIEFDENKRAVSIEEKPEIPKSDYAVTGLYFYDNKVVEYAKSLKPSARGELEITDLNNIYLKEAELNVEIFGRGFAWLDSGTFDSLIQAGQYIKTIEKNQGVSVACLEEIAFKKGWISKEQLLERAELMKNNEYGKYLLDLEKMSS